MSVRELVVLGTASEAPTRTRNHNGYLLRWDGEGILVDPGRGDPATDDPGRGGRERPQPDLRHPLPRRPL